MTRTQIEFVLGERRSGRTWDSIAKTFKKKFGEEISGDTLRKRTSRNEHLYDVTDDVSHVRALKDATRQKIKNSQVVKENKAILNNLVTFEDMLEHMESTIAKSTKTYKVAKPPKARGKKRMVVEQQISDIHVGLKTPTFDADVARRRCREFTQTYLQEVNRYAKLYQISYLHQLFLGDLIQSASMHPDSGTSCHLTDPEQLAVAMDIFFHEVILPAAQTGYPVKVTCMHGNHSRFDPNRKMTDPGKNYFSYTIYKGLEMLAKAAGLANVTFVIPDGAFHVYEIFGSKFLAEHGDNIPGGFTRKAFINQISQRAAQLGEVIRGIRLGHWHTASIFDNGVVLCNGTMVSDDPYAATIGYNSDPVQLINYYCETKSRSTSYYHSFPVNLK